MKSVALSLIVSWLALSSIGFAETLSPFEKEFPGATVLPAEKRRSLLQDGYKLILKPGHELAVLASNIVQSKGSSISAYDEVYFYESVDEYRVELTVNFSRRLRNLSVVLPPNLSIRISKADLKVREITECTGKC